jgi:hypothetical protein
VGNHLGAADVQGDGNRATEKGGESFPPVKAIVAGVLFSVEATWEDGSSIQIPDQEAKLFRNVYYFWLLTMSSELVATS